MTKIMGLVVALVAAIGVTLATPASSEAGGLLRWRRSYYVEPSYSPPVVNGCPTGSSTAVPGSSATYYPSGPVYSSGYYYPASSGSYSGWYRVGNILINGRRWGDIGNRYSYGDLLRW